MRPEEAQIGKRVRVRMDYRKANLRGKEGTIAKRWGDLGYPVLGVLLDDGDWQLFWYRELELTDEDHSGARDPLRSPVSLTPCIGVQGTLEVRETSSKIGSP
jgi:hypothetical protein